MRWLLILGLVGCDASSTSSSDLATSRDLAGADLAGIDLSGVDLAQGIDLANANPDLLPEPPSVRLIGRIDDGDAAGPRFSWSGSSIVARFSGTAVSVHLSDSVDHFKVLIDGADKGSFVASGDKTYSLATGLTNGTHDLLIYRQSEAFDGATQFFGLTFPGGGQLLAPPPAHAHKIELIGDSISNGYGDTGAPTMCGNGTCGFSLDTEDHYQSYGAITARNLDADLISISWSGIGMYHNCCGASGSTTDTMPNYYDYALPPPQSPTTTWDYSRWQPDLVMINLGTNDYTGGDPGQPFTDAYVTFVKRVRKNYPNAYIMLLVGTMLDGADYTSCKSRLSTVLSTVNDPKMELFELGSQDSNSVGCDCHPTTATHLTMAQKLTTEIKSKLGW